jgi:hypothetical protein
MDESSLRWQARIGSLKWLGLIMIIGAGIGLIIVVGNLLTSLRNPGEPQSVTIQQVVDGSIRSNQYVTLEGFAMYDTGYEQTENGRVIDTYYLLVDEFSGYLLVVNASTPDISDRELDWIRLVGMTHKTPTDLRQIIQEDFEFYRQEGFATTAELYIAEGEKPSGTAETAALGIVLFALVIVGAIPFFFPTTVFAPKPAELVTLDPTPSKKKRSGVFATGRFIKLKKVKPTLEIGKRMQKFTRAVANIIPAEKGDLVVYIHHVVRYNFIPVSKTHWGVFLNPRIVQVAEPGLQYGWKDRPAVQINYAGKDNKSETLLLTFNKVSDQAFFLKLLREKGYRIGSGISSM